MATTNHSQPLLIQKLICIGCEYSCDFDESHRGEDGNYNPSCSILLEKINNPPVLRDVATQTFEKVDNLEHIIQCDLHELFDEPLSKPLDNHDEEPPSMFCIRDYGIIEYITNSTNCNYAAQSCLDYYAKCTCCKRHQKNKPTVLKPWVELSHNQQPDQHDCLCACRAMSRHICRLFPELDDSVYE